MKYFFSWYITNNRDYRFESFDYAAKPASANYFA